MNTAELLDAAKREKSIESDYRLSKSLGVTTQAVSQWRSGSKFPGLQHVFALADMASLPPATVLAELERERAERAGNEPQAHAWREWVEKLGGVAAAVLVGAVLIGPGPSKASTGAASSSIDSSAYTSSRICSGNPRLRGRPPRDALGHGDFAVSRQRRGPAATLDGQPPDSPRSVADLCVGHSVPTRVAPRRLTDAPAERCAERARRAVPHPFGDFRKHSAASTQQVLRERHAPCK